MTAKRSESGRRQEALREAAQATEVKAEACAICGSAVAARPKLVYMREADGKLKELTLCPFCFLKVVTGVRA